MIPYPEYKEALAREFVMRHNEFYVLWHRNLSLDEARAVLTNRGCPQRGQGRPGRAVSRLTVEREIAGAILQACRRLGYRRMPSEVRELVEHAAARARDVLQRCDRESLAQRVARAEKRDASMVEAVIRERERKRRGTTHVECALRERAEKGT